MDDSTYTPAAGTAKTSLPPGQAANCTVAVAVEQESTRPARGAVLAPELLLDEPPLEELPPDELPPDELLPDDPPLEELPPEEPLEITGGTTR